MFLETNLLQLFGLLRYLWSDIKLLIFALHITLIVTNWEYSN